MFNKMSIIPLVIMSLTACTNSNIYSGDVYSAQQAKRVQTVTYGTITHLRPVTVQTNSDEGVIGSLGGAVLGGFLGNTIGSGTGRALATAAGAVAGSVAGSAAESKLGEANGVEIEIQQDDGRIISVVQTVKDQSFHLGQKVRLSEYDGAVTVSPR